MAYKFMRLTAGSSIKTNNGFAYRRLTASEIAKKVGLRGTWEWNESLDIATIEALCDGEVVVSFTSEANTDDGIKTDFVKFGFHSGGFMYYVTGDSQIPIYCHTDNSDFWGQKSTANSRFIAFDGVQTVPDYFYNWFIANARLTDLTGTTWKVPSGWTATAGYGEFNVNAYFTFIYDEYGETTRELETLKIGYRTGPETELADALRYIRYLTHTSDGSWHSNTTAFTLKITGGTDATNTSLISWLLANGTMI